MQIEARHVRRKQLTQYLDKELLNRERKNSEVANTPSPITAAKKRISTELAQSQQLNQPTVKKPRHSDSVSNRTKLYFQPKKKQTLVSFLNFCEIIRF